MADHPSAHVVAERFVRAWAEGNPDAVAGLYAPAVTIEMPFAAPLFPARTQASREELRGRFASGQADRRYTGIDNVTIHETKDPEVVIVECTVTGERLREPLGEFVMPLIMVMTIRDGLIVHSRDYNSPVAGARAIGILPQLLSALQEMSAGVTS
jgi:uncharacterized protein